MVNGEKSLELGGSKCGVFFENSHEIANIVATDKSGGLLYGVACGEQLFCFRYLCGEDVVFRSSSGVLFENAAKVCFAETAAFGQLGYRSFGSGVFADIIDYLDNEILCGGITATRGLV